MTTRTHPSDRVAVETVRNEYAAQIIVIGEADIANLKSLKAALAKIELAGAKDVQLQVSELAFVDVASLRHLTAFAVHLRKSGHHVTTTGARPVLQRMARILEVENHLGLS